MKASRLSCEDDVQPGCGVFAMAHHHHEILHVKAPAKVIAHVLGLHI